MKKKTINEKTALKNICNEKSKVHQNNHPKSAFIYVEKLAP